MSFMVKKKRFKFQVKFEVEELNSVPYVNAMLFCKVRLLDGGSFTDFSTKEEVRNHLVCWRAKFEFPCKMNANANTGVLEHCICRVSVRKELKGGKSFQKLGFADVNLSEFAGGGMQSRRYLLEGYDSKRRQDNSILKLNIDTDLLSGDPLFKVPESKSRSVLVGLGEDDLQLENKGASEDPSGESVVSATSSGFSSLPRKNKTSLIAEENESPCLGHARSASGTSQQSKVSGYSSSAANHSRQSSTGVVEASKHRASSSSPCGSLKKPAGSGGGGGSEQGSMQRQHRKLEAASSIERRVDSTRVDNDELVDELVNSFADRLDDSGEPSGLQLFITQDGTPVLGGQGQALTGGHKCVVMDT